MNSKFLVNFAVYFKKLSIFQTYSVDDRMIGEVWRIWK